MYLCFLRVGPSREVCETGPSHERLPGKGNPNVHGARPVHLINTMIKWIRTSSLSIKTASCVWGFNCYSKLTEIPPLL